MLYVPFGHTGFSVSRLSLGTMGFGNQINPDDAQRVMAEALEQGVNLFDTAESYGQSESVVGQFLPGRRERIFLATKVFKRRLLDGKLGNNSRLNILHSIDHSLRQLGTDYVDLYQLHHPDDVTPPEETLSTLDQLVRRGKVRYWGVSNHYAWQMAHYQGLCGQHGWEPLTSYQVCYNALDRPFELEAAAFCRRFAVATMVYSPLCGGVLSGKYQRGIEPPADSRVVKWGAKMRAVHESDLTHDLLDALKQMAQDTGVSLPQLAIQWLLSKPEATTILLGGSKPEHYSPMYAIADRPLDAALTAKIDELTTPLVYKPHRNQPVVNGPGLSWSR